MKKSFIKITGALAVGFLVLQGCRADLGKILYKDNPVTNENTQKGKELLDQVWEAQGMDKLKDHSLYSFDMSDHWKGMLGSMGKIWGEKKSALSFKYRVGSFDGQVTFKDGKHKGDVAGLQSWNYYEITDSKDTLFQKADKRKTFGLAAYQYFTEMNDRLRNAPIIVYAGEDEKRGEKYDLVICTWTKIEAHDEADQYVVWINKETGMVDFVVFTLRDNYLKMPGYKMMYGSIEFSDYKLIDGVKIPHEQTIYAFDPKKKKKKFLHQAILSNFKFDDFESEDLIIDVAKGVGGDYK